MNTRTSTLMSLDISIALIAAGIWFLWNHQNSFGHGDGDWITPYHRMMAGSGMGIVMILFWVAVLSAIGLVISGVISNYRSLEKRKVFYDAPCQSTPICRPGMRYDGGSGYSVRQDMP